MPKVAVTDYTFDSLDIETELFHAQGLEVVSSREKPSSTELKTLVADVDAVITQFASINQEVIAAMTKAKAIVRYGIGVDNVDLESARAKGIPVCNVPDYCIDEVADQTLAFILGLTRNVVTNSLGVKSGQWKLAGPLSSMKTLRDLTIGIVGCGRIGLEVIRRLVPFKCRVLAYDPVVSASIIETSRGKPASLDQLIRESDLISLHCPSSPQTRKMMNQVRFSQMKSGSFLINVARGDLVDTPALIEALQSGKLAGAALDVCDPEPIPTDSPLLSMPNVIVSAHIASASVRAVRRLRETVARIVIQVLQGGPAINVVNGVASR